MSYDTPLSASGQALNNLPMREQLRRGFKDMGTRSFSSAKNFGLVGAIFAGTECCIEGVKSPALAINYELQANRAVETSTGQRTTLRMVSPPVALPEEHWVQKLDRKLLRLDA